MCDSAPHATTLTANGIPRVVAAEGTLDDGSAIAFAAAFYRRLRHAALGRAFEEAATAVRPRWGNPYRLEAPGAASAWRAPWALRPW